MFVLVPDSLARRFVRHNAGSGAMLKKSVDPGLPVVGKAEVGAIGTGTSAGDGPGPRIRCFVTSLLRSRPPSRSR